MKRVVLLTGHYLRSDRKAGFHWLADAFVCRGHDVTFVTVAISWLSWLVRNYRMAYPVRREAGRCIRVRDRLSSYVWFTPYHPADLRCGLLNRLARPLFSQYGNLPLGRLHDILAAADLVVFESTPGLLLFDTVRRLASGARIVYRVSDDLRLLQVHPMVVEHEANILGAFDLVSVPSESLRARLAAGGARHLALHRHGVNRTVFGLPHGCPFADTEGPHAVFVGTSRLDRDFLRRATRLLPSVQFHVIGPFSDLPAAPNLHAHGPLAFEQTVAYLQHADIGLHCLAGDADALAVFADSLKTLQYTACRLPIVCPVAAASPVGTRFYYRPGDDESIRFALLGAARCDRDTIAADAVTGWETLAAVLAGESES